MPSSVSSYMMPFSNVAHLPLREKLRATQLAGFEELSLMPCQLEQMIAEGISPTEVRKIAEDWGIRVTRLDPLNTWSRIWHPDNMDAAYIATVDTRPERFMELADALGCTHMSLNATFPSRAMPHGEIVEHFAKICALAADHGLFCDLEFIPLWGVPTLEMAWDIVRDSGAKNGGLVLDAWHFVRGGSDISILKEIPGHMIHCVQLNDGPLRLPAGVSIKQNCYDRLFPGDGEFPLTALIKALSAIGGLNQVGPEVFSPVLADMNAEQIASKSADTIAQVLGAAGIGGRLFI